MRSALKLNVPCLIWEWDAKRHLRVLEHDIGALLLALLANDASGQFVSEFNSLACSGFTVKTLFDLDKHSVNAFGLYMDLRNKFVLALDSSGNRIWKLRLPLSHATDDPHTLGERLEEAPLAARGILDWNSSLEALAGSLVGQSGYVDGPAAKSLFNRPQSLAICDNGTVLGWIRGTWLYAKSARMAK
ncbi:uncharacterized protein LOC112343123 [Selaginella moellendorffii]|uniref:uncharacterized protein LOC112343123 n=1 Tax=Selaginella moellendorffii TaxID=88036 RepID=UPI000D1C841D|nr:uncharacterized protein LOC112343123 [Selaginella moellendorffii]|eukprot:XP_024521861.1 uncharacterized protein LOC112343123 [Selaginella moellendorffii]